MDLTLVKTLCKHSRRDAGMTARVSKHFNYPVEIWFDNEKKLYFVLQKSGTIPVWFRSFNDDAKRRLRDHLNLKRFKDNVPKEKYSPAEQRLKERKKMANKFARDVCDRWVMNQPRVGYTGK